jgi:hypothetical protein
MKSGSAIFLDTSIQIARILHSPETKARIRSRLNQFSLSVTSEVVKQEYKRRVCAEAVYLLNQINARGSLQAVQYHLVNELPVQLGRKRTICLDMLTAFFGKDREPELSERAKRYLRTLLRHGMAQFESSVGHVIRESGCACARHTIQERVAYRRYDLGPTKCSQTGTACGIAHFLTGKREQLEMVRDFLANVPMTRKSTEIQNSEHFIEMVLADQESAQKYDPCTKVGDLIIAMESVGIPVFFTLNGKESQHLCRALVQELIVRPINPDRDDTVCSASAEEWPQF